MNIKKWKKSKIIRNILHPNNTEIQTYSNKEREEYNNIPTWEKEDYTFTDTPKVGNCYVNIGNGRIVWLSKKG